MRRERLKRARDLFVRAVEDRGGRALEGAANGGLDIGLHLRGGRFVRDIRRADCQETAVGEVPPEGRQRRGVGNGFVSDMDGRVAIDPYGLCSRHGLHPKFTQAPACLPRKREPAASVES